MEQFNSDIELDSADENLGSLQEAAPLALADYNYLIDAISAYEVPPSSQDVIKRLVARLRFETLIRAKQEAPFERMDVGEFVLISIMDERRVRQQAARKRMYNPTLRYTIKRNPQDPSTLVMTRVA